MNYKKRMTAALLIAALAFAASGCREKIRTELPMKNIRSMMCNGYGDVFLLNDAGLQRYNLSSDKKLEYIHHADDLSEAEFDWINNGVEMVYTGLYVDRLLPVGEDGVTMVGKYLTNSLGRDAELFVLQDAADLGATAAYYTEIEKSDADFLNGVATDNESVYFKLNVDAFRGRDYKTGMELTLLGQLYDRPLPDGLTGAIRQNDKTLYLTETDKAVELTDGETAVKTYSRADVADAFTYENRVYVIYKDGRVTKTSFDGKEEDFRQLPAAVKEVRDAFIYDDVLYWFDKEGLKADE